MRAPDFWTTRGALAKALEPASALWRLGTRIERRLVKPQRAKRPILCVGNLVAGGAGKTPTALAIGAALRARGRTVHFLTRGYGGRQKGPLKVEPERHTAHEVGDEALLLAAEAPTWVAHDRVAGAEAAAAAGADIVVMDDGFQNPRIAKDLSLVVVDGGYGFGNGLVIPAGPLREPVEDGLARAQAAILIGADVFGVTTTLAPRLPVLTARLVPDEGLRKFSGRPVVAFAGIGRPAKFVETLREAGCDVVIAREFPDHYPYTPDDIMEICETADSMGAVPITTAKDYVRIPETARRMVQVVRVTLQWDDPAALAQILAPLLA
ncbi:MAG: tetraacyldisaccharide 4'-kinase [Alphaproteobacteria bacterium]